MHSFQIGDTYYSEDGNKSVTIRGKAPARRDRYHADYYPVIIVDAKGNEDYQRLSRGVIQRRFPRTAPKPETGKTYITRSQFVRGLEKEVGMRVLNKSDLARYELDYMRLGRGSGEDEWEIVNITSGAEVKLLQAGFKVRKVLLRPTWSYGEAKLEAVDVWSK